MNTPSAAARVRFDQTARCRRSCTSTLFHPLDDHYGLAPLEAARSRGRHAQRRGELEQGAARQCGAALRRAGLRRARGSVLTEEQFERLKRELEEALPGAAQCRPAAAARRRARLEAIRCRPKDMDFIEAKHAAAREIALAFGVPPMLLGIPGDNTYSNYQEANRVFCAARCCRWPTHRLRADHWLTPAFGDGLRLRPTPTMCRRWRRPRRVLGADQQGSIPDRQREARRDRLRAGPGRRQARVRVPPANSLSSPSPGGGGWPRMNGSSRVG